jgi:quercetin dioxygenase-like cupin family protein
MHVTPRRYTGGPPRASSSPGEGAGTGRCRAQREERTATSAEAGRRARDALRATVFTASLAVVCGALVPAWAQPAHHSGPYAAACLPVAERGGREAGCWITAKEALGGLPHTTPLLWHLDAYPTRAAAEAAKGPRGSVVESLGRVWLFTVAEAGWRPPPGGGGERVAAVGPLPTREGVRYVAQYMEGVSPPERAEHSHRHPGPEAWHNVAGRMCVETPEGRMVAGPGESAFVPEGVPHMLTGLGAEQRRSRSSSSTTRRARRAPRRTTGRRRGSAGTSGAASAPCRPGSAASAAATSPNGWSSPTTRAARATDQARGF